ncbi:winged helix-turn-helix transcriptional regulator [Flavobacterium geliluteum]|uniref:Helix-turn-helix transcriptional regulator n=1 Tax=Flavobacterium geliluteum TaxID=2816120 RepID=A0A940X5V8_9FLAO|nr:helix-turn-helix domain-containing protein [Flavobacterium geliluteum]MBP4138363.1 helix-turn-helix transcriptional regulator [Flavobacterium geliluteum]
METEDKSPIKECGKAILAIHDAMDILSGKWKISIIACLCFDIMRYTDLLNKVTGISGKMLSRELKELEVNGLITRTVQNTQPVTVEYEITKYGATLKNVTQVLANWGTEHRKKMNNKT